MKIRTTAILLSTATLLTAAGCGGGPTKEGIKARAEARARIDDVNARFTQVQVRHDLESGQFDRAMKGIVAAIDHDPELGTNYLLQGRIFLETDRLEDAIQAFLLATEKDASLAEAHYYAGIVFERWTDDEVAFQHYLSAYELAPDRVQYLLATAESLIALGELDEARKIVEAKINYFENNPALRHLLGQIALLEGDSKTAARLYTEAYILDPENPALHEELAWVRYDAQEYGACLETVREIQETLEESRSDLTHLEARCLMMLERATEAHGLYSELVRSNPSNTSLWIEFGTLAWKLGDYRRVAECSVQTINMAPDRFEGYLLKGLYERQQGRLDVAIELLQQASDLSNDSIYPTLLLGRTLEEAGRAREALTAYSDAVSADPTSDDARALHNMLEQNLRIATAEDE